MVVVMEAQAPAEAVEAVVSYFVAMGSDVHRSSGQTRTILGVVGHATANDAAVVAEMDGVAKVVRVSEPYKLASRRFRQQPSVVEGAWGAIGADRPWIAVEPIGLTTPSLGDEAPVSLPYDVAAGGRFDAAVSRSAEGPDSLGALACLSLHPQPIGAKWPVVFVTREPSWSVEAWIEAAERELVRGADQVVLLEAGSAYPDGSRTLEITAIPRLRAATHLPVVVDVPRVAGRHQHCAAIASAAVAAGASGVILRAWVGPPGRSPRVPATLPWEAAVELAERLRAIGEAVRA
jgi:3-deoxy-7-phosphoheptulonate synthase